MRTLTSLPTFKASSRAAFVSNLRASNPELPTAVESTVSKYHRLFFQQICYNHQNIPISF